MSSSTGSAEAAGGCGQKAAVQEALLAGVELAVVEPDEEDDDPEDESEVEPLELLVLVLEAADEFSELEFAELEAPLVRLSVA